VNDINCVGGGISTANAVDVNTAKTPRICITNAVKTMSKTIETNNPWCHWRFAIKCKVTKITRCAPDEAGGQSCASHKDVTVDNVKLRQDTFPPEMSPLKHAVDLVGSSADGSVAHMFSQRRNELWQRLEASKRENVAAGKPTSQSSTGYGGSSSRAVDGNGDTSWGGSSCTHTNSESNPWWRVDLGEEMEVDAVSVTNRGDCCGDRLSNFEVQVGDTDAWDANTKCGGQQYSVAQGQTLDVGCSSAAGRYVFVGIPGGSKTLTLCEVAVSGRDAFFEVLKSDAMPTFAALDRAIGGICAEAAQQS